MIRLSFECPVTHEMLRTMSTPVWRAPDAAEIHVIHCPKCSQRHAFTRADAILSLDAPPIPEREKAMLVVR